MIKKIIISVFLSLFLWIPVFIGTIWMAGTVFAQEEGGEFATSYDVIYDVSDDGVTLVTEKIVLKNLTSEYYANEFKITIGATQISDIKAFDDGGAMEVNSQTEDSSTIIDVKFNTQVVGLDKTLNWTLQFKSKDFAEKIGKVWEVRAPKISSSKNLESYNLTVSVPKSFGEPTLITPVPKTQTTSSGRIFLTFSKNQLNQAGMSASFGTNQLFDFDLSYHLENNNLVPILTNIALPPDTPFQDVIYQRLDPKPINVTLDDDGNYLAWYRLSRGEKLDIKLIGSVKLYTYSKVKNPILSDDLRKKYTAVDEYWEKDNPVILEKVNEALGVNPPQDLTEKTRKIYLYVVGALKYDSSRLNDNIVRFGAVTALNNPTSAVCMEFTDLFIAMARAAGIPTRELNGYAYTANPKLRPLSLNKDILHAWPEYWDEKKGWTMVDPTWENTTGGVDFFS
ncbi:MAG: transglutaminase-like domain-containing protein, partial [Candidatus Daviesbacteria bacterium]|nr:transglutaminase-like domain-containing protein [Candidatus Daviesbacteria bacterium]